RAADQPIPAYGQPAISGEAPAEFALIDEFAESQLTAAIEAAPPEPAPPQPGAPAADQPIPDYEQPAISGEAPAEFALIDEFEFALPDQFAKSPPAGTTVEQVAADEEIGRASCRERV